MTDKAKPRIAFLTSGSQDPLGPEIDFRTLSRILGSKYSVEAIESLSSCSGSGCTVVVSTLVDQLTGADIDALNKHRSKGGSVLILLPPLHDTRISEPLAAYLQKCGMTNISKDVAISSSYTKGLYHPSHLLLQGSSFVAASLPTKIEKLKSAGEKSSADISLAYPAGATFSVEPPHAIGVLTTGSGAFPQNAFVFAVHELGNATKKTRLMLCGSAAMFSNNWIGRFDNSPFAEVIFGYLAGGPDAPMFTAASKITDSIIAGSEDQHFIPDTMTMATNLRACLHAPDAIPDDFTELLGTVEPSTQSLLPQVSALYEKMGFNRNEATLRLINPSFEKPTPPLIPAVHQPQLPDPPGAPMLELFDLDTELANEQTRITRLAAKCDNNDLELFITQAGDLFGLQGSPKDILFQVLKQTVDFKKSNNMMK